MSSSEVTPSVMAVIMMMVFINMMVVVILLNKNHLRLRGCIVDWGRSAIGVLGKGLILISVLRLIAVHFTNYNYKYFKMVTLQNLT